MWAYRAVFTQTTSTGTPTVKITAQEDFTLLYGMIGRDNYAANRSTGISVLDAGDKEIAKLSAFVDMDNTQLAFPTYTIVVGRGNELQMVIRMGKGDYISIAATALIATETLTIQLRGLIKTTKPVVTATTTAGTIPVSVTYDKVI